MNIKDDIIGLLQQEGFEYEINNDVISGEFGQSINDHDTVVCRFTVDTHSNDATLTAVLYRDGNVVRVNEDDAHFVDTLRFMLHENYANSLSYWGRCDNDCDKPGAVFFTMDLVSLPSNAQAFIIMLYAFLTHATNAMKRFMAFLSQGDDDGAR